MDGAIRLAGCQPPTRVVLITVLLGSHMLIDLEGVHAFM